MYNKIRLKTSIILLFLCSFFSAKSQIISDSVQIDGHYRVFHFDKPVAANNNASLVFVMHGSGGTGKGMMNNTKKLAQKAKSENAVLVYPDGYKKYWNECRKAANSPANIENIDDNAFFEAMINYFKKTYRINAKQVFAVGTSGGGHMAYKLALTMPNKFKAITAIIANLPETDNLDCVEAKVPVSVMIINGTEDTTNPYNGGVVISGNVNFGKVRATNSTFGYWATLAGYKGEPKKQTLPDTDPTDGKIVERYAYKQKGKPEVVLLKVIGGKHDYPNDIDVHLEAWEFFKRQINALL